jgi:hypothetical protein
VKKRKLTTGVSRFQQGAPVVAFPARSGRTLSALGCGIGLFFHGRTIVILNATEWKNAPRHSERNEVEPRF